MKVEKEKGFLINEANMKKTELRMVPEPENRALVLLNANKAKGVVIKYVPQNSTSVLIREYEVILRNEVFEDLLHNIIRSIERFLEKQKEAK